MACTALVDQPLQKAYSALLTHPYPPGVRNLQRLIEEAWQAGTHDLIIMLDAKALGIGFDLEGRKELKNLVGTNKWIGTSGMYH